MPFTKSVGSSIIAPLDQLKEYGATPPSGVKSIEPSFPLYTETSIPVAEAKRGGGGKKVE